MTILLAAIGLDQITKVLAAVHLAYSPPISILNDFIRLQYAENSGIMLSLGSTLPEWVRFWLFTVFVGVMLFILLLYTLFDRSLDRFQVTALSLMTAGGIGNIIGRIARNGTVIDFVSVGFGDVRTAIFNVADMLVFAGVIMMVVHRRSKGAGEEKLHDHPEQPPSQEKTP
jgi:signal peptidase II